MSRPKETKEKVLDAALELFSEHGYRGTTTKAIAKKARVNEVTLFRHFGSKENIFFAVIDREMDIKSRVMNIDLEPGDDLVEDLTRIGSITSMNMIARAKLMKLIMTELDSHPDIWEHVSHVPFEALAIFSEYFKKAKKKGLVRDIDPEFTAAVFFSFFFRSLVAHAFMEEDFIMNMNKRTVGKFADIMVYGVSKEGR